MLLSADSGKKPHRYSQVVGLLAAGPRPPSPRLLAVSTAFQLPLAGEAGRASETRSTGTSGLPSLGGHRIRPDLGAPATGGCQVNSDLKLPPSVRPSAHAHNFPCLDNPSGGHATCVPVARHRVLPRVGQAFVHVGMQTPPVLRLAGCFAAGPVRSSVHSC